MTSEMDAPHPAGFIEMRKRSLQSFASLAKQPFASLSPNAPTVAIDRRGGPRNWDSLLRWDPDQGEGVWHATEETELSC